MDESIVVGAGIGGLTLGIALHRPFGNADDVISRAELLAMSEGYKQIAGYSQEACPGRVCRRKACARAEAS